MKIRFTTGVAGARFAYRPGEEADLADEIAIGFIRQKVAEVVRAEPVEHAVAVANEKSTRTLTLKRPRV